jgi:hypothetical protein
LDQGTQRYHHRRAKLLAQLQPRGRQLAQAQAELTQRRQARDALDTASLCRERILEKDQMMLNLHLRWRDGRRLFIQVAPS